jgi:hypothetical protein
MPQRVTISVTYADGTVEVIPVRPIGLVATERKFGGEPPNVEGTLYAAWYGLRAGNPDLPEFDDWLGTLDGIDAEGAEGVDPTEPESNPAP